MKILPVGAELLQDPVASSHSGSTDEDGRGGGAEAAKNYSGPAFQKRARRAAILHMFTFLGSIRCN
jgi:hypothetical protein